MEVVYKKVPQAVKFTIEEVRSIYRCFTYFKPSADFVNDKDARKLFQNIVDILEESE